MLDIFLSDEKKQRLPISERARLKCLPDWLSVHDIAILCLPFYDEKFPKPDGYKPFRPRLIRENGVLRADGLDEFTRSLSRRLDVDESRNELRAAILDTCKNGSLLYRGDIESAKNCLINKQEFEYYLQINDKWPVSGLLANWWADEVAMELQILSESQLTKQDDDKQRDFTKWIYDLWLNNGEPKGKAFFKLLKDYVNSDGENKLVLPG